MKTIQPAMVSGVMLLAVCAGCNSGSSSDSTQRAITALDSNRSLASLSDSEAVGYCHDLQNYFNGSLSSGEKKEVTCVIVASFAQFDKDLQKARSDCENLYNQCVVADAGDGGLTLDAGAGQDSCANAKTSFGDCTATVGEVNACEYDIVSAEKNLLGQAPQFCQTLVQTDAGIAYSHTDLPPTCASLQAKCPNALKATGNVK